MSLLQRAILSRRVGRLVLEQVGGIELVVLPDVFNPAVFRTTPLLVDAIGAHARPAMRVLDVGTGTGRLARKLARRSIPHVLGVDATPEMLAVAREKAQQEGLKNLHFALTALGEAPLPAADA